jgi:hypothetical protein
VLMEGEVEIQFRGENDGKKSIDYSKLWLRK